MIRFPLYEEEGEAAAGGGSDINALRSQMEQQNQRFQMLEHSIRNAASQQPQQQQPATDINELNKQIWANPAAAIDQIASTRAAQMIQNAVGQSQANDHETMVEMAKNQARSMDTDVFDRYRSEIEQKVLQLAPQYHRNVNVWKTAMENVAGRHYRELAADAKEKTAPAKGPAFKVSDGPASPSTRPAPVAASQELDEETLRVGRKFVGKNNPEEYMRRGLHLLANQGDPNDSSAPSVWDEVITFDSKSPKQKRKAS